jgi:cold shock protein
MQTGRVKFYKETEGYGFIGRDSGDDIFVHRSAVARAGFQTLEAGQVVQFETEPSRKGGLQAINLKTVYAEAAA